jgi:hypothetical protein
METGHLAFTAAPTIRQLLPRHLLFDAATLH